MERDQGPRKTCLKETLRTGGKILTDIADNTTSDVKTRDIISKHVTESINRLTVRGRERVTRQTSGGRNKKPRQEQLRKAEAYKTGHFLLIVTSQFQTIAAGGVRLSTDFDVFASKHVQTSVQATRENIYKPLASVDQSDVEFVTPADNEKYTDLNIRLKVTGKLTKADGTDLDATDFTAVSNNFLHSLFSQCSIAINGVTISQATEVYPYRAYLEIHLTYGSDAANSHLTNSFWYPDNGNMLPCDPTAAYTDATNKGFVARWQRIKQSKVIELYCRLHSDICNVPKVLIPGVLIQIKLTKTGQVFI